MTVHTILCTCVQSVMDSPEEIFETFLPFMCYVSMSIVSVVAIHLVLNCC